MEIHSFQYVATKGLTAVGVRMMVVVKMVLSVVQQTECPDTVAAAIICAALLVDVSNARVKSNHATVMESVFTLKTMSNLAIISTY